MRSIISAGESLLRIVYPGRCKACGGGLAKGERFFCACCLDGVRLIPGPRCTVCGRPYPGGSGGEHPCVDCLGGGPSFDMARAAAAYEGVVKEAIHLYKYRELRALMGYLGGFVEYGARRWFRDATVAAAVPLHPKRLRARGFNQSLFLAQAASEALGIGLSVGSLVRVRHTKPQVTLSPSERERNVKGAFSVEGGHGFVGESVLLVDDVYTTGATVKECARVLKKAGAAGVFVLTVARVVE
jgi:ComF family protein